MWWRRPQTSDAPTTTMSDTTNTKAEVETPAQLAQRVLRTAFDNSESFEYGNVGSELAYLCMVILESTPDCRQVVEWTVARRFETRHGDVLDLFNRAFASNDQVWDYIEIHDAS